MPKLSTGTPSAIRSIPDHTDFPQGWQWFGKLFIRLLVTRNRRRVLRTERKRMPVLDATIETVRDELLKARERGTVHAERVFNVGLFILLVDRDFAVLKVDMVSSFEKWRLRFTARQVALLMYESCDDLTGMLGKDFRDSLAFLGVSESDMKELGEICSRLGKFKSANHQFLYVEVRNLVAGHRAQDSVLFLETVEHLDHFKVFQLGAEFYVIVRLLTEYLTRTMFRMGQMQVVFKQLSASPKFMASLKSK
jgi:hypothetical protein